MAQVMTFPNDLKSHFFRDNDLSLLIIWVATFLMINSIVLYLQSLPLRIPTETEIADYRKALFRFKVEPRRESTITEDDSNGYSDKKIDEKQEENTNVDKHKIMTIEEKRILREKERAERAALANERTRQIARGIPIPTGPTVKSNGVNRSSASLRTAVGMMENGVGEIDLNNASAIANDVSLANRVKNARGDGIVSGDIGNISLRELDGYIRDKDILTAILTGSSLKMPEEISLSKGGNKKRSNSRREEISNVVNANKNQVQYCYWNFKRQDPNLRGQVTIKFTINATGIVTRVWFENSRWGGSPLRKAVEKAIYNVIMQWRFKETDPKDGEITAMATFIFDNN